MIMDLPRNWKSLRAKNPDEREASSWIAPNGDWYNCPFADHPIFAAYVLQDEYPDKVPWDVRFDGERSDFPDYRKCGSVLVEMGWLLVHYDYAVGCIITGKKNMTVDQYAVLYEYWGDSQLFRGWTIKSMWRDSINNQSSTPLPSCSEKETQT